MDQLFSNGVDALRLCPILRLSNTQIHFLNLLPFFKREPQAGDAIPPTSGAAVVKCLPRIAKRLPNRIPYIGTVEPKGDLNDDRVLRPKRSNGAFAERICRGMMLEKV
jgi:hypothetical protein